MINSVRDRKSVWGESHTDCVAGFSPFVIMAPSDNKQIMSTAGVFRTETLMP
jgi:hypothetical protein